MPLNDLIHPGPAQDPGPQPNDAQTSPTVARSLSGLVAPIQNMGPQGPQLSHEQAAETIYHLNETENLLAKLMQVPGIGKKDIKSDIYDVAAKMLAHGLLTVPQLMSELKSIPPDAADQKTWVEGHIRNAQMARKIVLSNYQDMGDGVAWAQNPSAKRQPSNHGDIMSSVMSAFRQKGAARG